MILGGCGYPRKHLQGPVEDGAIIAVGESHICRTRPGRSVVCWGENRYGQLGDGTTVHSTKPVEVAGLAEVVSLAVGNGHTCAVLRDGGVKCWGANHRGQLGIAGRRPALLPVSVPIGPATQISAGRTHTCARLSDETVACWGDNSDGQVGVLAPITTPSPPVVVPGLTQVVSVTTGNEHSCSVSSEGLLHCWGDNHFGQLGHGIQAHQFFPPRPVPVKGAALAVSAGHRHTCALLRDRSVQCWGENFDGQLGNGTTVHSLLPVQVVLNDLMKGIKPLEEVRALSAGKAHTCALFIDGGVDCWGSNRSGQLGSNIEEVSLYPTFSSLSHSIAISAGGERTCAVFMNDVIRCVGGEQPGLFIPFDPIPE